MLNLATFWRTLSAFFVLPFTRYQRTDSGEKLQKTDKIHYKALKNLTFTYFTFYARLFVTLRLNKGTFNVHHIGMDEVDQFVSLSVDAFTCPLLLSHDMCGSQTELAYST